MLFRCLRCRRDIKFEYFWTLLFEIQGIIFTGLKNHNYDMYVEASHHARHFRNFLEFLIVSQRF